MPRMQVADLSKGIMQEDGYRLAAPFDSLNLDIDHTTGRVELRKGSTPSTEEVHSGNGNNLQVFHSIGTQYQDPYKYIYAFNEAESVIHRNQEVYVSGANTANYIIDLRDQRQYAWERYNPPHSLTVTYASGNFYDLTAADVDAATEGRINRYAVCYRYVSDTGRVSNPSPAKVFEVAINPNKPSKELLPLQVTGNFSGAPGWADRVEYYMMREPFAARVARIRLAEGTSLRDFLNADELVEGAPPGLRNNPYVVQDVYQGIDADGDAVTEYEVGFLQEYGATFIKVGEYARTRSASFGNAHSQTINVIMSYAQTTDGSYDRTTNSDDVTTTSAIEFFESAVSDSFVTELPIEISGDPPPNLQHTLLHAGKIWGWDTDTNTVRFSLTNRYDVFPDETTRKPHAVTLDSEHQSAAVTMQVMPNAGGIYVFFRDRIGIILGQGLISGLYSDEFPPYTDIDASRSIPNVGTLSPRSIVEMNGSIIFLASDRTLRLLNGLTPPKNIGQAIQPILDKLHVNSLADVFAFTFLDNYYIKLGTRLYYLDFDKNEWGSYDLDISGAVVDQGGNENASVCYALTSAGLLTLFDRDAGDDTRWSWESQTYIMGQLTRFNSLIFKTTTITHRDINIITEVDGTAVEKSFIPTYRNRGESSVRMQGTEFRFTMSGEGKPPEINAIYLEYN